MEIRQRVPVLSPGAVASLPRPEAPAAAPPLPAAAPAASGSRFLPGLSPQQLGMFAVRFGTASPNQQLLDKLNEDLNDINASVRLAALKTLYDLPSLSDTKILRSLGRYVYYNDAYTPLESERVQGRIWAMRVLEKHRGFWGLEGLFNNLREIGNRDIATYATAVLGQVMPAAPEWMQARYRARLFDWIVSNNSGEAPSLSAKLLSEIAPAQDANYAWYLANMPGIVTEDYNTSSSGSSSTEGMTMRKRLSTVLGGILGRNAELSLFQKAANAYLELHDEPERGDRAMRHRKRILEGILTYYPSRLQQATFPNPAAIQQAVDQTLTLYGQLRKKDVMGEPLQKRYAAALAKLVLKLPEAQREPVIDKLLEAVKATPEDKELVITLYEVLYRGDFNRKELWDDFLSAKYNNYSSTYPTAFERWKRDLTSKVDEVLALRGQPEILVRHQMLLSESDPIFRRETYIRKPESEKMDASSFQFNPTLFTRLTTSDALFNLKFNPPPQRDWSPKFSPPVIPTGPWELEPFATRDSQQEVNFYLGMTTQFQTAVSGNNTADVQDVLFRTMKVWLNDQSRAAYDVLKDNLGVGPVLDMFMALLWRLDDSKLKRVPPKQMLSLIQEAAQKKAFKTSTQGDTYRSLICWMARTYPDTLRGELLETALEVVANTPEDAPAMPALARTAFNLLKFGLPEAALTNHKPALQKTLDKLTPYLKMDSGSAYRRDLDWAFFANNTWETDSGSDQLNMDQKKNFDLAMQLALRMGDKKGVETGIQSLANYYQQIRRSAYADEIFIIRFLRDPRVVEAAVNTENESLFQSFREMLAWYKVFEAVPVMIKKAAEGPLRTTSWLMGAITAMDLYAVPELEKIIATAPSAREKELAQEALGLVLEPKRPFELFRPFPYALPEEFATMAVRPRQGTPDQPNSPDNAQQIAFPGLLDEVPQPEQPSGPRSGETPPPLPPPTTPDQVRFPGLIDLTGPGTETPPPSLSYLQLMERALIQARDAASAEARQQALTDLVFFANQFQEVSAGSRTNIAFVSPEKTALATRIVAQLPSAQSSGEKGAYLQALGSLQDPVTMEGLVSFLNGEADPALRQQTVGILGNLGRRGAYEPLRRVLFDASQPLPLRESVVQALIRLDDRATLLTLAQGQDVPETLRTLGVAALGELRMDAPEERAALLTALAEAPAGSALKAAAIRSLGQMADPDDAEILTALTAAAPDDETPAVKLAVLSAFEFLDYTEAVRQCVARLRQDGNYDVSRAAAQLISRRANG
jgi:hypothetical protein